MTRCLSVTRLLSFSLALLIGFGAANAAGKAPSKGAKAAGEPAQVEGLPSPLVAFGSTTDAVIAAYEKQIDRDHQKEFEKLEPGVEMRRLEDKVRNEKNYLRRSFLKLDAPPTNLDGTKVVGEFTYGNKESVLRVERRGKKQILFFIRGKFWKVIDVYSLGKSSKWGADFTAATEKLEKKIGVPGRPLAASGEAGRPFAERDWADEKTHLRAIDWGDELAVASVDRATEARLVDLRTFKAKPREKGILDTE